MRKATVALSLMTLALLAAAGCSGQRNLMSVRENADYFAGQGDYERSLSEYREYLQRLPEDYEVRYRFANTLLANGDTGEAREQYAQLVDIVPNDDRFIDGYARALEQGGETQDLARFLNRMTTQRGDARDWIRLGKSMQKNGDVDGAKAAFASAARADGGRTIAPWVAQADLFASVGDARGERAAIERALFIEPQNPDLVSRFRGLGGIPGPTAGVRPEEWVDPTPKKK